jgi:DNA-binding NtrC family response regulator
LVVDHPMVSRRHLALELVGAKLRVTDLGSSNGSTVGGIGFREVFLSGGETIVIGGISLSVTRNARGANPEVPVAKAFGRMLGESRAMRRLYPLCEKLAKSKVPVLIEGETGTGKEVLAEALHEVGPLASAPFIVFDCTAVPATLAESELFGHERGAFTGATNTRKGVFEQADGGTLFIDEIGDLDAALQPKLLRAIERGEIRRVGGDRWISVDVRLVSATRRDLDHEVQEGRFRDDLFHRLAVTRVELPPLRARKEDIPLLAAHFARQQGAASVPEDLLVRWSGEPWPGNVRELRNAVSRYVALGSDARLEPKDVPPPASNSAPRAPSDDVIERVIREKLPLAAARAAVVEEFESRYLEAVLAAHGGVVTRAAEASGIARRHFQRLRAKGR